MCLHSVSVQMQHCTPRTASTHRWRLCARCRRPAQSGKVSYRGAHISHSCRNSSLPSGSLSIQKKHKTKHKSNFIAFRLFSIGGHQRENSKTSVKLQPLQGQQPPLMRLMPNFWSHTIQLNLVTFYFLFLKENFLIRSNEFNTEFSWSLRQLSQEQ